jgi:hypothetical protein
MTTERTRSIYGDGRALPPVGRGNLSEARILSAGSEPEYTGPAKTGRRSRQGEQKGNRESKKPKKEKIKTIAAAPSQKAAGWQPTFGSGKKK